MMMIAITIIIIVVVSLSTPLLIAHLVGFVFSYTSKIPFVFLLSQFSFSFLTVIKSTITCYSLNGTILFVFPLRINHSSIQSMSLLLSFFFLLRIIGFDIYMCVCCGVYVQDDKTQKKKNHRQKGKEMRVREREKLSNTYLSATIVRIRFEGL